MDHQHCGKNRYYLKIQGAPDAIVTDDSVDSATDRILSYYHRCGRHDVRVVGVRGPAGAGDPSRDRGADSLQIDTRRTRITAEELLG